VATPAASVATTGDRVSRYTAGRRAEYRAQRILEAAGYVTARMAGSHGAFDVIAWNGAQVRLIQVKRGSARMTPAERETVAAMAVPAGVSKELWRFPDRCRAPLIDVLN
jgi:hypothetical protein